MTTTIAFVTAVGILASTLVYKLSQWLGSDDPFAIELVMWWIMTDILLSSKLRGWQLRCTNQTVRDHSDAILAGLILIGTLVLLAVITLSLVTPPSPNPRQYRVLSAWSESVGALRLVRSTMARSLAGGYSSMHLLVFLS